jgi:hypothetical protein
MSALESENNLRIYKWNCFRKSIFGAEYFQWGSFFVLFAKAFEITPVDYIYIYIFYFYRCTGHFEDSLIITYQQMH